MEIETSTTSARRGLAGTLPLAKKPKGEDAPGFVYRYLKEKMILLEIPPNTALTETSVAAATGVSRTPVREAFFRLSSEKLLQIVPRRGALVAPITLRQLYELGETRAVLERHAARQICEKRIDVSDTLRSWIELQSAETFQPQSDEHALIQADRSFHQTMVAAVGNTELANLYKSLGERQMRTGLALFRAKPERRESAIVQHYRILDALQEWDLEDAIFAIDDHLMGTLHGLEASFTE